MPICSFSYCSALEGYEAYSLLFTRDSNVLVCYYLDVVIFIRAFFAEPCLDFAKARVPFRILAKFHNKVNLTNSSNQELVKKINNS